MHVGVFHEMNFVSIASARLFVSWVLRVRNSICRLGLCDVWSFELKL